MELKQEVQEVTLEKEEHASKRDLRGVAGYICGGAAILLSCFHLYTGFFGNLTPMLQRGIHLFLILFLVFFLYPHKKGAKFQWLDIGLLLVTLVLAVLMLPGFSPAAQLDRGVLGPTDLEILEGWVLMVLTLLATRRVLGWPIVVIALIFIVYAFIGPWLPGMLFHTGLDYGDLSSYLVWTTEGIFGMPLGVAATFVALFVLFGVLLEETGAGKFFIDLAYAVAGRVRGGPAQTAVFSSALMGSISGSAVSNVVTTGAFTIPLMKKTGYSPRMAGAIEAVASTGGQIMPPVMGAVAFVMADMTGLGYVKVMLAAIIPAFLYYISLSASVYFEARKEGLKKLPRSELPNIWEVLRKGFYLFTPIIVLIVCMVFFQYSATRSAMYTIIATTLLLILQSLIKDKTFPFSSLIRALRNGAELLVPVAVACATAGIIIGVIGATSLGVKFSQGLIDLAGGILPLALILMMAACIILGMGLPTTAAYIITAVLGAQALVEMGVPLIAAHFFILYFAILSFITPPVALAAYAGAGIAKSDPFKTGFTAWRLGLPSFIVPFLFVYDTSLLGQGSFGEITWAFITACIGVISFAASTSGWFIGKLTIIERILWFGIALLLLIPHLYADIVGLVFLLIALWIQVFRNRKESMAPGISPNE